MFSMLAATTLFTAPQHASTPFPTTFSLAVLLHGALALDNGRYAKPPMGWSTWNAFHRNISQQLFMDAASMLQKSGMQDVGYGQLNIDGGWWAYSGKDGAGNCGSVVERNATGYGGFNLTRFPDAPGMSQHLRDMGFSFGMYFDGGKHACCGAVNTSFGFEMQDAYLTVVQVNATWVKIDACGTTREEWEGIMTRWDAALKHWAGVTGYPAVGIEDCHNGCQTDADNWFDWCPQLANVWRSSQDIQDDWKSVLHNLHSLQGHATHSRPYRWATPDILQVGNPGLTFNESLTHFSLWAVTSSPLIAGFNPYTVTDDYVAIFKNTEVIHVDQTYCASAGDMVLQTHDKNGEAWAKPLENGAVAVVFYNLQSSSPISVTVPFTSLPFTAPEHIVACGVNASTAPQADIPLTQWQAKGFAKAPQTASVRDLISHTDLPDASGSITCENIAQGESCTYLLTPKS